MATRHFRDLEVMDSVHLKSSTGRCPNNVTHVKPQNRVNERPGQLLRHITGHSGAPERSDIAKMRAVQGALHIRSTVDYVRPGSAPTSTDRLSPETDRLSPEKVQERPHGFRGLAAAVNQHDAPVRHMTFDRAGEQPREPLGK